MDSDIQLITRSRPTILEILETRGYNTDSYKDIHPEEIQKLTVTNPDLLRITVSKRADSLAGAERCIVLYWISNPVRLRLEQTITNLFDEDNPDHYNKDTDEIIVILAEPYHEVFDITSVKLWNTEKIRINFFQVKNVVSNPSRHSMVPPHRKLTAEEIATVIAQTHIKTKAELPHIKYHRDIQTRVLGLVPGDVVEIQRPSGSGDGSGCGIYTLWRICTP